MNLKWPHPTHLTYSTCTHPPHYPCALLTQAVRAAAVLPQQHHPMRVQLGSNKRVRLGSTVVQDENKKYKSSLEQGAGLERGGHPYGVKPLGNRYLDQGTGIVECRNTGLGVLHPLEDGKVQDLFAFLSAKDLCALAPVSKAVYIFCHDDSLWRQHCLDRFKGDFRFQGTWRATYQHEVAPEYPIKHKPLIVQGFYSDELFQPWLCASADIDPSWAARNTVPRRSGLSVEDFVKQYETPNRPVILRDVVKDWPAFNGKWTKEALLEKYGETVYKCGRCDMKLKDYLQYADQVCAFLISTFYHFSPLKFECYFAQVEASAHPPGAGRNPLLPVRQRLRRKIAGHALRLPGVCPLDPLIGLQ